MKLVALAGIPLLLLSACASAPARPITVDATEAAQRDLLDRLSEKLAHPDGEDAATVMNTLEHLMPSWQTEQRRGQAAPLENILTIKVVTHFDDVLGALQAGPRERQLVAAWALGFARVPQNDRGIPSPNDRARVALVAVLTETDDELLRNALLGLWKLGDPATPIQPLVDLLVQHHDPDVRANAALALGSVLRPDDAAVANDALLVALGDEEPRVRVHAALLARRFPSPAASQRMEQLLPREQTPLVRAAFATALGAARSRDAAPLLVGMLSSPREVESSAAHNALTEIFGTDKGPKADDWKSLLE
jgi:hypothetical protein